MISACRVERPEEFEQCVVRLQAEFAAGDTATRRRLLQPAHAKERFENYDPDAPSLSDADARLLIANQEGYAYWGKYESYLHLDPAVQRVIGAVRNGDIETLRDTLRADPAAANPRWVAGFHRPTPIPNDSLRLTSPRVQVGADPVKLLNRWVPDWSDRCQLVQSKLEWDEPATDTR